MIIPSGKGFKIKSHTTGKIYPKLYATRKQAMSRLAQMLMFKNMKGKG